METVSALRRKYKPLNKVMDERTRRLWAAGEAEALGWGGVSRVAEATGLSRTTITAGLKELENLRRKRGAEEKRIRKEGGGRIALTEKEPKLVKELERLVESTTRGDPESPLRWTCKSTTKLAEELTSKGYQISARKVAELLRELNYSLQSTRKTKEGKSHPDRDAQFKYINRRVKLFQRKGQPVISIDTKKKELIGEFSNAGREWRQVKDPQQVNTYDFPSLAEGKGIPYGVYDVTKNNGWVSVGTDHDTSEFAGETIRRWWKQMGRHAYPEATELLITSDSEGSNGARRRLWKVVLQDLANETGLDIHVCHFPPGTSKWNKIEHRMFSHITQNWRGRPLTSHEVMVNLIANTTTKKGLKIKAKLDKGKYPTGIEVSDEELAQVNIKKAKFHGNWNYQIAPQ